ncbi:GAP1-N2 domain-containing protein [Stieleria varia]|uniref:GTPase-associated protein 1 N-terminal domain-containing protein n=1 Tax=Stieleria varia TaxID=2528005 RepID=A0A5C5ZLH6_9BACT|nr:hypothetical protein [Stieleria varia]TWT88058.1 hypothetical protein Pla52n_69090 [Stieleria varia]
MILDQLIYGSANRNRMKGYQLLGQSDGVDTRTAKQFCRWAPSHGALGTEVDSWGLSFFPLENDLHCIARTMHGAPEYSGRGGMSVVTRGLVISSSQLSKFDNDPIALARTAFALGHLILPANTNQTPVAVSLPTKSFPMEMPISGFANESEPLLPEHAVRWVARETASLLKIHERVMICGACDPLPILYLLFELLDSDVRPSISFACGLQRSTRRLFRVQFTDEKLDHAMQRQLAQQSIATIDLSRVLV